jgi:hypothetical protein
MTLKKITSLLFGLLIAASVISSATENNYFAQREEVRKLAPKYRAFLAETREFMRVEERKVFLGLDTDKERDYFIQKYWEARKGWDNISTLYLLRMVQVLDLTEEQTAKIFPKVNRVEKEKREMNRKIGQRLREIRAMVRQQNGDEENLARMVQEIRDLRKEVKNRDEELEGFLSENLTVYQQAKYLIFVQDFLKDLREKLNKAREAIK